MNEESQVRGCYKYNITFTCTNQETVSVLEKTQANKTFRTRKQTKTKQQQISNKYSNHVVYYNT